MRFPAIRFPAIRFWKTTPKSVRAGIRVLATVPGLALAVAFATLASGLAFPLPLEAGRPAEPECSRPGDPPRFRFRDVSPKSLAIDEDGAPVLVYNHGTLSREGVPASFARASYIHPLMGLDGKPITDDFPRDHYHHRGLFWAWPHVTIDGKEYESWVPSTLKIVFERWIRKDAGAERAVLALESSWVADGKKVAREEAEITVHPARKRSRSIDLVLTWTALEKPIVLRGAEGKSYGGLTLRYAPQKDATITVPTGVTKEDLSVAPLAWADLTATFEGTAGRSGAAIFIHPSHPDHPPTWLTRHYGCLCVGWPGVEGGTLEPGKPVRCAYRIWIHAGDATVEDLVRAYEEYLGRGGHGGHGGSGEKGRAPSGADPSSEVERGAESAASPDPPGAP